MKKLMIAELAVLAVLLIGVAVTCMNLSRTVFAPDIFPEVPDESQESTAETSIETTTVFVPDWKTYLENRTLLAQQYFVYDCNTESFLILSGMQDEQVYPASITKLATALVALEYLEPTQAVTADRVLDMVAWGSSVADIRLGDSLTVEQLVEAMLLPSGNDAAYVLAAAAGRKIAENPQLDASSAVTTFMNTLNTRARELGMTNTHFVNPDGIHDQKHYMSFADLALLGKLSMENATIMKYANLPLGNNPNYTEPAEGETVIQGGDAPKPWKNTNALINPDSPYYCRYAVGLKTGQTPSAGSCLLSAFRMDGQELIIGVFGCPEVEDRFDDTLQLFNKIVLD